MKEKIIYLAIALIIGPAAVPLLLNAEEASTYFTVQVESRPALDVPYVPTPQDVVDKMLSIAEVSEKDILYDLGCGDGRVVVSAAKERHVQRAVGVDIDPKRIRESNENARRAGVSERVAFYEKNLFDVDFSDATVMTLYLLPSVNLTLRPRLLHDLKPGARIVSHDFDMGEWQPDRQAQVRDHTVYYWIVPANVHGDWSWSITENGRTHMYELRLAQRFQRVESARLRVDGAPQTVRNVSINGEQFEFMTEYIKEGKKLQRVFRGSVIGHSMSGSILEGDQENTKWYAKQDPNTAKPIDLMTNTLIHL